MSLVPMAVRVGALLVAIMVAAPALASDRVDQIKSRGYLICGLAPDHAGFSVVKGPTSAEGLDADLCRGIAAAIFGSPGHVRFEALETIQEFLGSDIDVVFHELTWTFSRELTSGIAFGPIYFFDGQAFLARRTVGVGSAAQLTNASVCVESSGTFLDNLIAFIQDHAPNLSIVVSGKRSEEEAAFFSGACDLLTGDASEIYSAARLRPGDYVILSDRLSKEPLAPVVRTGDGRLLAIVRWSIFAAIEAEELGVTSTNVGAYDNGGPFGSLIDPQASPMLGLSADWARNVIRTVGNYAEAYERSLGPAGNVTMARGLNELWTHGGLLYAIPLR